MDGIGNIDMFAFLKCLKSFVNNTIQPVTDTIQPVTDTIIHKELTTNVYNSRM